jgi:hypothetical protein
MTLSAETGSRRALICLPKCSQKLLRLAIAGHSGVDEKPSSAGASMPCASAARLD